MRRPLIHGYTWWLHWSKLRNQPKEWKRYLWWPVSFAWGGEWNWFRWHGIEATHNYLDRCPPLKHCFITAQVYHLGKLKIVLGRWR